MAADYVALATLYNAQTGTLGQRLATINAMTVTGSVPTQFSVSATDLYGAFDAGEWHTLAQTTNPLVARIKEILALPGQIPVGSGTIANLYLFNVFATSPATLLKLAALAVAQVQPWWQAHGFPHVIDYGDVKASGAVS